MGFSDFGEVCSVDEKFHGNKSNKEFSPPKGRAIFVQCKAKLLLIFQRNYCATTDSES